MLAEIYMLRLEAAARAAKEAASVPLGSSPSRCRVRRRLNPPGYSGSSKSAHAFQASQLLQTTSGPIGGAHPKNKTPRMRGLAKQHRTAGDRGDRGYPSACGR